MGVLRHTETCRWCDVEASAEDMWPGRKRDEVQCQGAGKDCRTGGCVIWSANGILLVRSNMEFAGWGRWHTWGREVHTGFWRRNSKERNHLEDLDVDGTFNK